MFILNNEILHAVDMFTTLSAISNAKIPNDRPIDGIDMSGFLKGGSTESGRDGFPVYVGEELHAAK